MMNTFLDLNEVEFEAKDCKQPKTYKKLLFGLAFFHAVLQVNLLFLQSCALREFASLVSACLAAAATRHAASCWPRCISFIAVVLCTLQERRKFGSIGFNNPYEWMNRSDFDLRVLVCSTP